MTLTEKTRKMSPTSAFSYFDQKLKGEIGQVELKEKIDRGDSNFQLIDVRSKQAYEGGHIPGAKLVPYEEFDTRGWEFSEDKDNIVYCYSLTCQLADRAARWTKLCQKVSGRVKKEFVSDVMLAVAPVRFNDLHNDSLIRDVFGLEENRLISRVLPEEFLFVLGVSEMLFKIVPCALINLHMLLFHVMGTSIRLALTDY